MHHRGGVNGRHAGHVRRGQPRDAVQRRAPRVEDLALVLHHQENLLHVHRVHELPLKVLGAVEETHRRAPLWRDTRSGASACGRPTCGSRDRRDRAADVRFHSLHQLEETRVRGDERRLLASQTTGAGRQAARDAIQRGDGVDGAEVLEALAHNLQDGASVVRAEDRAWSSSCLPIRATRRGTPGTARNRTRGERERARTSGPRRSGARARDQGAAAAGKKARHVVSTQKCRFAADARCGRVGSRGWGARGGRARGGVERRETLGRAPRRAVSPLRRRPLRRQPRGATRALAQAGSWTRPDPAANATTPPKPPRDRRLMASASGPGCPPARRERARRGDERSRHADRDPSRLSPPPSRASSLALVASRRGARDVTSTNAVASTKDVSRREEKFHLSPLRPSIG